MTKQEFKEFCHEEFSKRDFKKRRNMWYLSGKRSFVWDVFIKNQCQRHFM